MYCDNCHKQSPDNFKNCVYCGALLSQPQKKKPTKFVKSGKHFNTLPVKTRVALAIILALVIIASSSFTAIFTSSKPESVVKKFALSLQKNDASKYYELYDDSYKEYKKENQYYDDTRMFEELTKPLRQSEAFYESQCGENVKITYTVNSLEYLSSEELEVYNKYLFEYCGYTKLPSELAKLDIKITASGEKGEYESVYRDFYCLKLRGKWYKADYFVNTAVTDEEENADK